MKRALIVVDLQNDFLPGGALPVPKADEVVAVIDPLLKLPFDLKIATQDWHPEGHVSFETVWPVHCVQGTFGAELIKGIDWNPIEKIFYKGTDENVECYSVFSGELLRLLKEKEILEVFIAGLATDYCIKYSVLDLTKNGFKTTVILDACRAVNKDPSDESKALDEMKKRGAIMSDLKKIQQLFI